MGQVFANVAEYPVIDFKMTGIDNRVPFKYRAVTEAVQMPGSGNEILPCRSPVAEFRQQVLRFDQLILKKAE